jgi:hypothetical protein
MWPRRHPCTQCCRSRRACPCLLVAVSLAVCRFLSISSVAASSYFFFPAVLSQVSTLRCEDGKVFRKVFDKRLYERWYTGLSNMSKVGSSCSAILLTGASDCLKLCILTSTIMSYFFFFEILFLVNRSQRNLSSSRDRSQSLAIDHLSQLAQTSGNKYLPSCR